MRIGDVAVELHPADVGLYRGAQGAGPPADEQGSTRWVIRSHRLGHPLQLVLTVTEVAEPYGDSLVDPDLPSCHSLITFC